MKGYKETHMNENALHTTREDNVQQRAFYHEVFTYMFICKTVILNCNSGIFLMVFCRQKTRNLPIDHGQFHTSDKPDEQEKLSKSSRTRIVHPSNCLRKLHSFTDNRKFFESTICHLLLGSLRRCSMQHL